MGAGYSKTPQCAFFLLPASEVDWASEQYLAAPWRSTRSRELDHYGGRRAVASGLASGQGIGTTIERHNASSCVCVYVCVLGGGGAMSPVA
jgi:hypothetical protein